MPDFFLTLKVKNAGGGIITTLFCCITFRGDKGSGNGVNSRRSRKGGDFLSYLTDKEDKIKNTTLIY